jgi:hypothetical protein
MTTQADTNDDRRGPPWRIIGWSIPALLLLIPLLAGAPWTVSDYVVMGGMFGLVGLGFEVAVRMSKDVVYRVAAGVAVITAFLLVWVNVAVGFLGNENNPYNLIFFVLLGLTLIGAFLVEFRAKGLGRLLAGTAAGQALIGIVALMAGLGEPGNRGIYEAFMGTSMFVGLWLASAWLFSRAARRETRSAD